MTKRNRDALAISDGACNPVAIVNSMVAAIAEMRAQPNFSGWDELCADPALKLMTHQLAFLQGIQTCESLGDYWSEWRKACEGGEE